jgi:hypothetical protein
LDAQHKFIDDGLKNINTQFTSKQITAEQRDDKINQFWAQYSPKLQDAINRADSLGANTQEFASTMDAEASATWNPDTEDSNLEDKVLDPNTGLMVDNPAKRHTAPTFQAGGGSSTIPPHPGQPPHSDGQGPVKHAAAPVPGGDTMHILKDLGYDYGDGGDATPAHKDDKPHVNSTPTPQPHDNKHGVPAKPPVKLTGGGWGDDGGTAKSGLKAKLGSAPSSSASMPAGLTQGQVDQFKRLSPADQQATLNDTQHVTPEMRAYLQQFASKK